ncbi:MAG: DNA-binding response regulator [Solirubrobacterales bacterium]|nr:DNA-binding response regulator [Solirubrobacterales bacterium]
MAAGRTDQQIADALFVSRRTVTTHASHIHPKLGAANRAEAAALATRAGLA